MARLKAPSRSSWLAELYIEALQSPAGTLTCSEIKGEVVPRAIELAISDRPVAEVCSLMRAEARELDDLSAPESSSASRCRNGYDFAAGRRWQRHVARERLGHLQRSFLRLATSSDRQAQLAKGEVASFRRSSVRPRQVARGRVGEPRKDQCAHSGDSDRWESEVARRRLES